MAATSLLARLGLRAALLGSAASLVYAAPIADGNVSNDAHTYANRTGWFHPTATSMGFVTNGSERLRIYDDGGVQVGGAYGTSPGANMLRVSANATSAVPAAPANTRLSVFGADAADARILISVFGTGVRPALSGRSARGTAAAPTATQNADILVEYGGWGYGATGFSAAVRGSAQVVAAENWTDAAQGTRFGVFTTAAGGTSTTEKFRINSDGGAQFADGTFLTSLGAGGVRATRVELRGALALGTYSLNVVADSAADRSVALFGVLGISNGFTVAFVQATGSMIYTFAGGTAAAGLCTFAVPVIVPNGTAAAPGLRVTSEASGLYRHSSVALGMSVTGTQVSTWTWNVVNGTTVEMTPGSSNFVTLTTTASSGFLNLRGSPTGGARIQIHGLTSPGKDGWAEIYSGANVGLAVTDSGLVTLNYAENHAITRVSGDTTLDTTQYTVEVDASAGAVIITLPQSTATRVNGRVYNIKKVDASANTVTIQRSGADLIDGATTVVLTVQYQSRTVQARAATPGYSII